MELKIIRIDINQDEARLFRLFQQYHDDFQAMIEAGVFRFHNGTATIFRDQDGTLQNIQIEEQTYKRRKIK